MKRSAPAPGRTATGDVISGYPNGAYSEDTDVDSSTLTVRRCAPGRKMVRARRERSARRWPALMARSRSMTTASINTIPTTKIPTVDALNDFDTLTDVFTYTVTDAGGQTDTAQLSITIHGTSDGGGGGGNSPPVAGNDTFSVRADYVSIHSSVIGNDSDPDFDTLEIFDVEGSSWDANVFTIDGIYGQLAIYATTDLGGPGAASRRRLRIRAGGDTRAAGRAAGNPVGRRRDRHVHLHVERRPGQVASRPISSSRSTRRRSTCSSTWNGASTSTTRTLPH